MTPSSARERVAARAESGGVTPDDTPGFPVIISQPGSYVLTGNLDIAGLPGSENIDVIQIFVDNVTLDLNGFIIRGGTECTGSGATLVCGPIGVGSGIRTEDNSGIAVLNGMIRGMGLPYRS